MQKVIEAIRKYNKFLITAHINPEGDSLGSQLGMKALLESLGKMAVIVNNDAVPDHYKFLPDAEAISNRPGSGLDFEAAIILDCPTLKRIGNVRNLIAKDKFVINIDHHISNENFGNVNWVDPNASSAGEMVYKIYKELGVKPAKETALVLYIAILTDTGSFNYDNTSSVTHEIAGELLGYGIDPASVSESVYERRSVADIKLFGLVLSTIKVNKQGDVAYLEVTRKILKETGSDLLKSEGFVNYARSIDKVQVAIIFKEDADDKISVSFRSKGEADVNMIASFFGGGGHVRASGCVIEGALAEVEKKVLDKIDEVLHGRSAGSK
ncbi:MAG: bifunctional oligoribonuclease/PAP phosphatase NrnA [Candidatus Omnitrophota bacterium]|nr:bifunctional oligoribonuclease/PAP phosphatase NrnA [Candidatus Omnitrophota bacterium]